jgi:hypothetical protein
MSTAARTLDPPAVSVERQLRVTGAVAGASTAPSAWARMGVETGSVLVAGRLSAAAGGLLVEGDGLLSAAASAGAADGVGVSVDRSAVGGVVAVAVAVAAEIGWEAALSVTVLLAVALPDDVAVTFSVGAVEAVVAAVTVIVAVTAAVVAVAAAEEDVLAFADSSLSMSVTCTRKKASITGSSLDSRDVRVDCGLLELSDLPCSKGNKRVNFKIVQL